MTAILEHLSNWPARQFEYEAVLDLYRNRLPLARSEELRRQIAADRRWQSHWNSIRDLECERDSVRAAAAELMAFPVQQASEKCRVVAATGGEVLWPLVLPNQGALDTRLGNAEEIHQHLDDCVYCRLMTADLRAELLRQQSRLPPGEMTLRDWLLDHHIRESLTAITRQLLPSREECLQEVLQLQAALKLSQAARDHFWLANEISVLSRSVSQCVAAEAYFFLAAGARPAGPSPASPTWYTKLYAPPAVLQWNTTPGEHEFQLQMRVLPGEEILSRQLKAPCYRLTAEERGRIPTGKTVKWSVADFGEPVFAAVFVVLGDEEQDQLRDQCAEELPPSLINNLSLSAKLWDHELYDSAIEMLRDLQRRYCQGAPGFVVNRMLAGVWNSVREKLKDRRMDVPESDWANEHVTKALEAAYEALPN